MEAQLTTPAAANAKRLAVYTITEKEGLDRPLWTRIGSAFKNRDGSFNLLLEAIPLTGKLHVREFDPNRRPTGDSMREEVLP